MRYDPMAKPDIGQEEKEILEDVIDSGWIGGNGPFARKFEELFATLTGWLR